MLRRFLTGVLLLVSWAATAADFPRPASLEPAVRFWTKVYSAIDTNQGYLHDHTNLNIIYETLDLPLHASSAERQRLIKAGERRVAYALAAVAKGKRSGLSDTERRALAAWPAGTSNQTLRQASERVRFQLGQADRFREGLVRSGQWRPHIRRVLAMEQLPEELEVLPHVESSFNPSVYSKVAAAGLWQFMPATAQQYMRVDHIIDERMDPFIATKGAAKLLKRNYQVSGSWPLALTAYNHGLGGITRAAKAVGSKDIGTIVANYQGPAFGFASRNFYACFLAALEVDRNAERYFGSVNMNLPIAYDTVKLHHYTPVHALANQLQVSLEELRAHNPALREPIWTGEKFIPRGTEIRLPKGRGAQPLEAAVAAIPSGEQFGFQRADLEHKVRPGESLSGIASRYNTSISRLMALNGLHNHRIRAGDSLRLPGSSVASVASKVAGPTAGVASASQAASAAPGRYVVRSGDSLWSIARKFNMSASQLASLNGIGTRATIRAGQTLKVAGSGSGGAGGGAEYIIQPGDSLWAIAQRFNVSQANLMKWNNLKSGHSIKAGQVLRVASR